jgi:hypothetical protein
MRHHKKQRSVVESAEHRHAYPVIPIHEAKKATPQKMVVESPTKILEMLRAEDDAKSKPN